VFHASISQSSCTQHRPPSALLSRRRW
jgi:hypothetical protein